MLDSSFSTALGYIPSDFDNESAVALAIQRAAHNREKAKIPSNAGSLGGLRATDPQEMTASDALRQGLKLYNTWQDSRNYSSGNPWDLGAAGFKNNYSSGLDAPFFDRGGMTYWDSDSDITIPTNSFDFGANAEVAAGLGQDNGWWQGIKNWFSGGN